MPLAKDALLSLEEIKEHAKDARAFAITGVYFLFSGTELVYIGKAKNVYSRITAHVKDKRFDRFAVIECEEAELNDLESAYILRFKPSYNAYFSKGQLRYLANGRPDGFALMSA